MAKRYFEVLNWASSFLEAQGKEGYAIRYVFLERKGWDKTQWLLHMQEEMPKEEEEQLKTDLAQLLTDYPAQYLLGQAEFYGHSFIVNEHTLIPRPETEELVERCLKANPDTPLTVVDVGTGTGAIAISLKLARPNWRVIAIDLSEKALTVAKQNAKVLGADIEFYHGNGLQPVASEKIDLLISNPPYISEQEWYLMDASVRTYEPKTALFAENNGLALYQQLIHESQTMLKADGKIYFEIGFQQGAALQKLLSAAYPQKTIKIEKDLSGNDRLAIAE